jgi:hypothetical protein
VLSEGEVSRLSLFPLSLKSSLSGLGANILGSFDLVIPPSQSSRASIDGLKAQRFARTRSFPFSEPDRP